MLSKPVSRRSVLQGGAAAVGATALGGVTSVQLLKPQGAAAQDDERGILIMRGGVSQFPPTFNPLLNDVRVWLYDGLVRFDTDVNPIPDLAESWEISEDGLVYTFHLRQDVVFHDGTPMTAADVVFTAEKTLDEGVKSPYRSKFIIDGQPVVWEQVDDFTVTATLPQPSGSFLSKTSRADEVFFCILPKHLLEGVEDMTQAEFNQNPVGTGPFKFVSYETDQQLVMEANDDYYQGRPGVKEVVRLNFPNEQSALAALQAGDIDVASLREAGNVKTAEETEGLSVQRYDSNWVFAGRFKMDHPVLSDQAVRAAISHAVDRENLVKAAVSPTASTGNSPINIGWAASPDVTVYEYDPEKAKAILDEAGWTGDGIREKDGQRLSFTVTLYPDYAAPDLAAGMQQLLQLVGIEMNINQLEAASFETEVYQNQNFDMYLDWQGFGVDPDIASRWITNDAGTGTYLDNPSNYSNPDVDVALTAASTALTQDERQQYLWEAQNLITADAAAIWLQLWEAQIALDDAIGGYETPGTTADMDNTGIFREPWMITSTRG
ncbi:MAG: peptide ABC transporter substrate-binding protein [Thermomicrobiales bacterium]|nr:peptide ABC transporter substrate-binding protein [Thermomicrobiales bacterium]